MIYIESKGEPTEIRMVGNTLTPPRWWQRVLIRLGVYRYGITIRDGGRVVIENCDINS